MTQQEVFDYIYNNNRLEFPHLVGQLLPTLNDSISVRMTVNKFTTRAILTFYKFEWYDKALSHLAYLIDSGKIQSYSIYDNNLEMVGEC